MTIQTVTTEELGNHLYEEVSDGVFVCKESGRIVICQNKELAMLIILNG